MSTVEKVQLGRTGEKVSAIGIGTWQWGSYAWGWDLAYHKSDVRKAFDRALELGIDLFDTAEAYGGGRSEALIGEMLNGRREQVFIATKVLPSHATARGVEKAAEASLRRLGTNTIDLYQLHFPNPFLPIGRLVRSMERLVRKGKVRYIGVSNVGVRGLQKAREALASEDIVSNQVHYSLLRRKPERKLLPYVQRERVTLIAYSPLGQGLLTGKYSRDSLPRDLVRSINSLFAPGNLRRAEPALEVLRQVASAREKSPVQVALNWLIRSPSVLPIPGVKKVSHVEDIAGALDWRLTHEEWKRIDDAFREVRVSRRAAMPWIIGRSLRSILRRPKGKGAESGSR